MMTEITPTNGEFKFDCPKCGQHILVATDWMGLRTTCPSCQTRITIPSAPGDASASKSVASLQPTRPTIRIELPSKPAPDSANQNARLVEPNESTPVAPANVTGREPWPELVQRLEKGALVEPAVLATALYRELTTVRRRLDKVERLLSRSTSIPSWK